MSSALAAVVRGPSVPFGRAVDRRKDSGAGNLEPLSVYLEAGVVPRASRDDNYNRLGADLSDYLIVKPGDIVFNKLRTWQGGLGVSKHEGIVSPAYYVCRPTPDHEPRFLHYLLRSSPYLAELTRISKFMPPSQFDILWEDLRTVPIPKIALAVQRAIADFLDNETARIDALITKKRRMIGLLDERYESRCASTLLAGLDPVHGTLEGCLVGSWEVAALGVLVMLHRGFDLPLDERQPGAVPVVSSGGVSGSHSTAMCSPPGVVTGRYGTIGEIFFVDKPYWPLNTTLFVSDFRGNDERWVYHLLQVLPLDYDAAKSAVTGINRNVIGGLRVPRPPVDEQRRIADLLDRAQRGRDRAVGALERQVDLLQERRQALITAAVTGQLQVPGVAA